jgi:hypothetical protein
MFHVKLQKCPLFMDPEDLLLGLVRFKDDFMSSRVDIETGIWNQILYRHYNK